MAPRASPRDLATRLAAVGRRGLPYVCAVVTIGVIAGASVLARPWFNGLPSPPFLFAITVIAWLAGLGPGLVACAASVVVLDYLVLPPLHSLAIGRWHDLLALWLFAFVGASISWLAAGHRRADGERSVVLEREHAARAEAERANARLRQVQSITDAALMTLGTHDFLRQLLGRVRLALGSDTATILLLDADGAHLNPVASDGLRDGLNEQVRVPVGCGVAGRIAESDGLVFDELEPGAVVSPFLRDRVKSLVGVPLRAAGRSIGVIHVGSTTPRRFTTEDLALLRLVAERIAVAVERDRAHEAEIEARAAAEAANRAKDDFLATLSHELRTPLTSILGWARMVRKHVLTPDKVMAAMESIERNAAMQARLVDDLLDVSRIIAGKLVVERVRIDLLRVVESGVDVTRSAAVQRSITIDTKLDPAVGTVLGDFVRLQQVVVNLIGNAIKFSREGGLVSVRLERAPARARLVVADTGEGIERDELRRIFDRFHQAESRSENGTVTRHGGLGLGLAIVKHIVELHGGTVAAESAGKGRGATFTVEIPVIPPDGR